MLTDSMSGLVREGGEIILIKRLDWEREGIRGMPREAESSMV